MDLNDIRSAITLVSFLMFLGILVWTWSRQRKTAFEEAAGLPFAEENGEKQ